MDAATHFYFENLSEAAKTFVMSKIGGLATADLAKAAWPDVSEDILEWSDEQWRVGDMEDPMIYAKAEIVAQVHRARISIAEEQKARIARARAILVGGTQLSVSIEGQQLGTGSGSVIGELTPVNISGTPQGRGYHNVGVMIWKDEEGINLHLDGLEKAISNAAGSLLARRLSGRSRLAELVRGVTLIPKEARQSILAEARAARWSWAGSASMADPPTLRVSLLATPVMTDPAKFAVMIGHTLWIDAAALSLRDFCTTEAASVREVLESAEAIFVATFGKEYVGGMMDSLAVRGQAAVHGQCLKSPFILWIVEEKLRLFWRRLRKVEFDTAGKVIPLTGPLWRSLWDIDVAATRFEATDQLLWEGNDEVQAEIRSLSKESRAVAKLKMIREEQEGSEDDGTPAAKRGPTRQGLALTRGNLSRGICIRNLAFALKVSVGGVVAVKCATQGCNFDHDFRKIPRADITAQVTSAKVAMLRSDPALVKSLVAAIACCPGLL